MFTEYEFLTYIICRFLSLFLINQSVHYVSTAKGRCQDDSTRTGRRRMKLKRTMDIVGFQGCDNGRCNETRMIRMIKCGFSLFYSLPF